MKTGLRDSRPSSLSFGKSASRKAERRAVITTTTLSTDAAHGCARTVRALADYRAVRERSLRSVETPQAPLRAWVAAALARSPSVLCTELERSSRHTALVPTT